jgi:hypothetical protein
VDGGARCNEICRAGQQIAATSDGFRVSNKPSSLFQIGDAEEKKYRVRIFYVAPTFCQLQSALTIRRGVGGNDILSFRGVPHTVSTEHCLHYSPQSSSLAT